MKKRTTIFGKECRKEGMDWGRLAFGCVWLAFLSVMAWVFVRMAVAPSLKDRDPVSCRIVKSSVKMENVEEFAFTAEYAYEWLGCFVVKLVRELRAPRLALTLSCARWEHGSPAHVNWSLDDPEVVEALEIFLESSKMEGSGKHSRKVVVSSQRCCCHVKPMVPAVGSFGFEVPSREGERRSWAVVAKLKVRGFRREITATYALPRCQCQSLFQDA